MALRLPELGRGRRRETVPGGRLLPLCCRDRDGWEVHCWAKANGRPWRGLWSPAGHSSQPVPWARQLNWLARGRVSKRALWRKPGSPLTSLSTWGPPFRQPLAESPTKGHSGTAGHLGEGPTVAPTNGWAGPLTVTHWQWLTLRRGPLWHQPMAEQDH